MSDKKLTEKLRSQYTANPPEGMTRQDILHLSDNGLLDMHYFLNEDFSDDDEKTNFCDNDLPASLTYNSSISIFQLPAYRPNILSSIRVPVFVRKIFFLTASIVFFSDPFS